MFTAVTKQNKTKKQPKNPNYNQKSQAYGYSNASVLVELFGFPFGI